MQEVIIVGLIANAMTYAFLKFTQYCEKKKK